MDTWLHHTTGCLFIKEKKLRTYWLIVSHPQCRYLVALILLRVFRVLVILDFLRVPWLLDSNFQLKWKKIKDQKYLPIIFSGLFLIELLWLSISKDTTVGLNVLRIKLPLLLLPIIIGSCTSFSKREWKTVITTFFIGILVSTIWVYLVSIDMLPTKKIQEL